MRQPHKTAIVLAVTLVTVATLPAASPGAEAAGTITGKVVDESGNPLPGAAVVIEATTLATSTDRSGAFTVSRVPAGSRTVTISFLGHEPRSQTVEVPAGSVMTHDVTLARRTFEEAITVRSEPLLQGQAKALNQQKNALNITNVVAADQIGRFPDPNAAEAAQRIPAVTLQRDQGEGRFVIVRGTEVRFNSMMVNGERMPSAESSGREVPLDVIPADLLEAIEVTKALTPDMDGDAIGGAVNLVTKLAPEGSRIAGTLAGGRNQLSEEPIKNANFTYGNRVGGDGRLGFLLSGSFLETDRATHGFEPVYDDGELDELDIRAYEVTRERTGITGSFDYQASTSSQFSLRAIWNEFSDLEIRRKYELQPADERIDRELKDRFEEQHINTAAFGGDHILGPSMLVDYRVGYSYADEEEPNRLDTTFRQKKVAFDPNVSPDHIDPDNIRANPLNEDLAKFELDAIDVENNTTEEEDVFGLVNVRRPFYRSERFSGMLSFGAKGRFKEKRRDNNLVAFEADDILLLDHLQADWKTARPFFRGRYDLGLFSDPGAPQRILPGAEGELDPEVDLADYDLSEDTVAAYGMVELGLGNSLSLLGGLRYENTDSDYRSHQLVFDEEGDFASLSPVFGGSSYGELLPSVHVRKRLDEKSNLRAAVSRSLARPNFGDLVPFRLLHREDEEIVLGNPALNPTTAWNLDVMFERFFETVGLVSAGVFYKDLTDTIFIFTGEELVDGDEFEVTQPLNAGDGKLYGFETAYQQKLRSLPGALSGLGIYLNYTYTDSEGDLLGRRVDQLPGQAEHVGNFALSYEKRGFSGRISVNYHDRYRFLEVGKDAEDDIFIDHRLQLDFAAQQRVTHYLTLFVELINLTDERYRVYRGTPDRPIQEELYGEWGMFGVKLDF